MDGRADSAAAASCAGNTRIRAKRTGAQNSKHRETAIDSFLATRDNLLAIIL